MEPAKDAAVDDVFGAETALPAKEAPAAEPKDAIEDLFGSEKTDAPATPAPEKKSGLDDLFGTESTEPAPAKTEAAPAQNESIDDLFGTPETKPAEGTTEPVKPKESLDDLFGKPVSIDAAGPASSNIKTKDSQLPVKPEAKKETPNTPAPQPETESSPKKGNADPLDELFGLGEFTPPQQFRGAEFQTWVDNTGTYSVKARLAVIYTDRVKLIKENGKFTTVSLSRLSDRDFAYVQWVASNLAAEANAKFVKKDVETSDTDSIR
jgi:hypothetical protein